MIKRNYLIFIVITFLVILIVGGFYYYNSIYQQKLTSQKNNQDSVNKEGQLALPLGTGKYSFSGPMKGGPYFCQSLKRVMATKIGAHAAGPWIDENNGVWYPGLMAVVDGQNYWPNAYAKFIEEGDIRKIEVNNLPTDGYTGNFPVAKDDDAYNYDRNPNSVREKAVTWEIPRYPEIATTPTCVQLQTVGYVLNGISLYSATDGQGRDPAYEVSDSCLGHPGPDSVYHYHIVAGNQCIGLGENQISKEKTQLIGYALDGFGIYSQYEDGKEIFADNLDECNGHVGNVLFDGIEKEMYHYHVTRDYPYTISCFKGTIIDSETNRQARRALNMPPLGS